MIVKADCMCAVPVAMLTRNTRIQACARTILRALRKRTIFFHKLREEPTLTDGGVAAWIALAKNHRGETKEW